MTLAKTFGFLFLLLAAGWVVWGESTPEPRDFEPFPRRVLFVGMEGADWEMIRSLAGAGGLPAFSELAANSVAVPVSGSDRGTILPPGMHPSKTWTGIVTGHHAPSHDVQLVPVPVAGSYDEVPVTSIHRAKLAVWEILSHCGLKTAVVGGWATWPAEWVNGSLVSDRFFLDRFELGAFGPHGYPDLGPVPETYRHGARYLTWPDELADELTAELRQPGPGFGEPFLADLQREAETVADPEVRQGIEMLIGALETDRKVTEAALALLHRDPEIDFTAVFFQSIDVASHMFWKFADPQPWIRAVDPRVRARLDENLVPRLRDVLPRTLRFVDELIGALREATGEETTTLLTSGHRFGPETGLVTRVLDLNPVLERLGYLVRDGEGKIDFSRTRVFDHALQPLHLFRRLSLNLAGRYPEGFVEATTEEEIEAEWDAVFQKLMAVRVRPGWQDIQTRAMRDTLFFSWIRMGEELQLGVSILFSPDTVVHFPDGTSAPIDEILPPTGQSGRHREGGFLAIAFPGEEGHAAAQREVPLTRENAFRVMIAPTILSLFGLPLGTEDSEMAGAPLLWMLDPEQAQRASIRTIPSYEAVVGRFNRRTLESDRSTPIGRRHAELREFLTAIGYVQGYPSREISVEEAEARGLFEDPD
jgi:predicted AlkP superfamily phosphohydrolase/phosphomutase